MSVRLLAIALAAFCLTAPASAGATQVATIDVGFSPYRLGGHTAVSLGFAIRTTDGTLPSALTGLEFHYPSSLGLGTSELGTASCAAAKLAYYGPQVCPANSIMGRGSALAKFQVSPEISEEPASIALVAGPSNDGYVHMLIAATGVYPAAARIVMSTVILPGRLQFTVPLVPGIPEGPDVAVVGVHVTLGGNLVYHERRRGRRVAYRPRGVLLPRRCPRGGFRFDARFSFLDGTTAQAQTVMRCPR